MAHLEHVVIRLLIVRVGRDDSRRLWIPHDDVCISTNLDDTLAWVDVEDLGRIRGSDVDELRAQVS